MGQDPRVEAVADPICRMLGHGPIDRAPLMVADAVRGKARELLAAADAAAWQPIETAPKDKQVLILRAGRVSIGWFNDTRYDRNPSPYWGGYDAAHYIRWARKTHPTHWQPLPPPPSPAVPLDDEGEQAAAEPTEDEVERAAVAIYESMRAEHEIEWDGEEERLRDCYRHTARAALIAARSRI